MSAAAQGSMDKGEDSRKCILCLQVHCAPQCPSPNNVKGAAPCKSNGAAWSKAPWSRGLPVGLFPGLFWEAQRRTWRKNNSTWPTLCFRVSQWYSPVCLLLIWEMCYLPLCSHRKINFPPILLVFREFPAQVKNIMEGLVFGHHLPKGWWCSGGDTSYCKRNFASVNL